MKGDWKWHHLREHLGGRGGRGSGSRESGSWAAGEVSLEQGGAGWVCPPEPAGLQGIRGGRGGAVAVRDAEIKSTGGTKLGVM